MIALLLGGILLMVVASKKNAGKTFSYTVDNSAFGKAFYGWVSAKEGKRPDNSNLAGNATAKLAPCVVIYNNKEYRNIKSIGGVLFSTFEELAPFYHYEPTCENFASLSNHLDSPIWVTIVNHFRKKGLAFTKDPILSSYIGFWYWGGWRNGIVSIQDVKDVLNSDDDPKVVLRRLVDLRIHYFTELGRLVPSYRADGSVQEWIEQANKYFDIMAPLYDISN